MKISFVYFSQLKFIQNLLILNTAKINIFLDYFIINYQVKYYKDFHHI
jgi:hypothetical protein